MGAVVVVKQGDTFASIAKAHGFFDWRTVYFDPANAALRKLRPNPNLLFAGDRVTVPDKQPRSEDAATGKRHTFFVGGMRQQIRIVLKDLRGDAMAQAPYELVLDGQSTPGTTNDHGLLKHDIPIETKSAELKADGYTWDLSVGDLNPMPHTPDDGVSGAQGRLRNLGYEVGPIDGILGPQTKRALKQFQTKHGLQPANGELTDATAQALAAEHGC